MIKEVIRPSFVGHIGQMGASFPPRDTGHSSSLLNKDKDLDF